MKDQVDFTWNVTSIVLAAMVFGLAAGLPIGYVARQLYSQTSSSTLTASQQN